MAYELQKLKHGLLIVLVQVGPCLIVEFLCVIAITCDFQPFLFQSAYILSIVAP